MKVLVVGGGGREHTLVWKISQSKKVKDIYCAPGNGGISKLATCIDIKASDIDGIIKFSKEKMIDLVVVAPDDPLAEGMVDALEKEGIRAFGPVQEAAIIEWSKAFSKVLMKKYNIPTAEYEIFNDSKDAIRYVEKKNQYPVVIKADGLALGKGVIIAQKFDEAKEAIEAMMTDKKFGDAGATIVVEEFLEGKEVSILAFTDGKTVVPMVSSQDYKKAYDGNEGPNTGGMGTFSPSKIYDEKMAIKCMNEIFMPTIRAMEKEGRKFKGVLYFGLIITEHGPKVIEYNSRFGDPETQVVLPRLETDLIEIFEGVIDENLAQVEFKWNNKEAVCVIMASGGYPANYEKGKEITGIDKAEEKDDVFVFHAGTILEGGKFYSNGGRVLGVTALDANLELARKKAYEAVEKIHFDEVYYRKDISMI